MGKGLTLILGGARSGKSTYAEQLAAQRGKRVAYVATAQAWDDEMALRIANHQAQRAAGWITLEAPQQVGATVAAAEAAARTAGGEWEVVLVDCLTLLANNVILALPEPVEIPAAEAALRVEVDALLAAYAASNASWILVSNEVGLGIVPAYPLGRVYRDALGRANQQLAAMADEVLFMVAGLPMRVK
jgi:adenosylcobinamide kinase / adenosylcobinamide-phosphate guanylyltransferase